MPSCTIARESESDALSLVLSSKHSQYVRFSIVTEIAVWGRNVLIYYKPYSVAVQATAALLNYGISLRTDRTRKSVSTFTKSPIASEPSVVFSRVCGMSATVQRPSST